MPPIKTKDMLVQILGKLDSIDNRLDGVEKRLDGVEQRLDSLENRVGTLEKNMVKVQSTIVNINAFIDRDSQIIEADLNSSIMAHLQREFYAYTIEKYDDKLKSIRHHENNNLLTEFDGLYLLKSKPLLNLPETRIFIIVESKRYTTLSKVHDKLKQRKILEDMVAIAKTPEFYENNNVTKKFRNTAATHGFDKVTNVLLYIGGPVWEKAAFDEVKREMHTNRDIGYIKSSSTNYTIKDSLTVLHEGGARKTRSSKN